MRNREEADDVIFMRNGADLVPLAVAPYEAETVLQGLLEDHSQLLAGAQMNRADPPRFLLVRREAAVADREDGSGRWSLDHLFLDQSAIPTMVEVKRSTDTRIRREVVGQMLDYAANGPRYWPAGHLQSMFEESCNTAGLDPDDALLAVIGPESDADEYWAEAERNLRSGRLRLIFVADIIPTELRAIIEFLNARMSDTEVYGVEVRRYAGGDGVECLVPRLVGKVASAERGPRPEGHWDEETFFPALRSNAGEGAEDVARRLLGWAVAHGMQVVWGAGAKHGNMNIRLPGASFAFLMVRTRGDCSTMWGWPKGMPEERQQALKDQYLSEVNQLLGVTLPTGKTRLTFGLDALRDQVRFDSFCAIVEKLLMPETVQSV